MYAQCPKCDTIFQVNEFQLTSREGLVRCGRCLSVFNAAWNLLDTLPEKIPEYRKPTPVEQQGEAPPQTPAEQIEATPVPDDIMEKSAATTEPLPLAVEERQEPAAPPPAKSPEKEDMTATDPAEDTDAVSAGRTDFDMETGWTWGINPDSKHGAAAPPLAGALLADGPEDDAPQHGAAHPDGTAGADEDGETRDGETATWDSQWDWGMTLDVEQAPEIVGEDLPDEAGGDALPELVPEPPRDLQDSPWALADTEPDEEIILQSVDPDTSWAAQSEPEINSPPGDSGEEPVITSVDTGPDDVGEPVLPQEPETRVADEHTPEPPVDEPEAGPAAPTTEEPATPAGEQTLVSAGTDSEGETESELLPELEVTAAAMAEQDFTAAAGDAGIESEGEPPTQTSGPEAKGGDGEPKLSPPARDLDDGAGEPKLSPAVLDPSDGKEGGAPRRTAQPPSGKREKRPPGKRAAPVAQRTRVRMPAMKDTPRRPIHTWAWAVVGVLLTMLLTAQGAYFYLDDWIQRPALRPYLGGLCETFDCGLPPLRDIHRIDLVETGVAPHPSKASALRVSASLVNRAAFSQPYPLLEVSLTNRRGQTVARRSFIPKEYLGKADPLQQLMPINTAIDIVFDITSPDPTAVGYEVQLVQAPVERNRVLKLAGNAVAGYAGNLIDTIRASLKEHIAE